MAKDLAPVTSDFFDSAPQRSSTRIRLNHPPAAVFAALAEDPAGWGAWFPGFGRDGRYLGPGPFGVGTQRQVSVRGMTMLESVIAWEPSNRWAFRIDRTTMPGVRAFAEDYRLAPDGAGTMLTWTLATDLSAPLAPLAGLLGRVGGSLMRKALGNLDRQLASGSA